MLAAINFGALGYEGYIELDTGMAKVLFEPGSHSLHQGKVPIPIPPRRQGHGNRRQ